MKTLEQEAQEYFDNNIFCDGITPFEEDISKRCFIAGATSKWVLAEKIKAKIEVLENVDGEFYHFEPIYQVIQNLQTLLKELENES